MIYIDNNDILVKSKVFESSVCQKIKKSSLAFHGWLLFFLPSTHSSDNSSDLSVLYYNYVFVSFR